MNKKDLNKLQNHFDSGIKDSYQVSRRYKVNDRVHFKGTVCNGISDDKAYPYLKIKWDSKVPIEFVKTLYDLPEIKQKQKKSKAKKEYHNIYLEALNIKS